jgi:hypothetical protein
MKANAVTIRFAILFFTVALAEAASVAPVYQLPPSA